ncbi:hypothetical protein CGCF415_v014740 [Colletotrichum fructicola]|uniref:Uncharacterized protein n=1 Tax=Colletotrichum fructicola (strain Nara gc5) TaxID=1213859 RepID=L2FLF3_COLFN|nr:hypothetical protein CGCFRS4_v014321 [Colletotrichum fructicola]KAF4887766.1 hypothetical protein CGCF415_v014740 [Colletotrichum fructicola]KAF4924121.1 hypothetical protein CGCF245_v014657 [Colletotrichum fructicola]
MEEAITGAEATMAPEDNKAPRATAAPEKSRTPATTDTLTTTTNTLSSPAKTGSSPVRDGSQDQRRKVSLSKYDGRQQIKSRAPSRRGRSKYKLPTTESNPLVIDEDSSGNPSLDKKAAGTVETGAKKSESPTHSASKKVSPPEGKTVPSEDQPLDPENAKPGHDGTRLSKRLSSSGRVKKPGGTKQKGSRSSK